MSAKPQQSPESAQVAAATRGARAQRALSEYLDRAIATRQQQPGTDLIGSIITTDGGEEPMSEAEISRE
jgi:cytochrome P450